MKHANLQSVYLQLTAENRRTLRRMVRYLDSYSLNEVAYEDLVIDLGGMALECQQRGQSFAQAVGMDEVAFCRELVANCPRETAAERALGFVRWLIAWLGAVLPVMFLLESLFSWMTGYVNEWLYVVPLSYFCKYCAATTVVSIALYFTKRLTYRSQPIVWTGFSVVFLVVFITVTEVCHYWAQSIDITLSPLLWLVIFTALFLAFHFAKRCTAMTIAYRQRKHETEEK